MDDRIRSLIERIQPADAGAMAEARLRQDYRVKVPRSLGRLEEISIRIAGITGKPFGNDVGRQAIILMCADNGVVEEGVASAPQTVTLMQTVNFTKRITGVGTQAAHFGIDILDIDVGVRLPIPAEFLTDSMLEDDPEGGAPKLARKVVNRRIADGTRNFLKEPAMTEEETVRAILTGAEAVAAAKAAGIGLLGVGEMGIGNTTTGSALICALTGEKPEKVAGRGGGLNDEGLARKAEVLRLGLEKYGFAGTFATGAETAHANSGELMEPDEALRLLSCLGGFDIAGMAGAYLAAAAEKIPVVVDGVISIAAALLAKAICPQAADYMFTSHRSQESGYSAAAGALGIEPMFDLGMKLGEGSGCPIAFKIIEAAVTVMNDMWSLEEAQVDSRYLEDLRGGNNF